MIISQTNRDSSKHNETFRSMRKAFLKKIKKMLEAEQAEIVARTENHIKSEIDISGDELDSIQANIISHSLNQLALRNKERAMKIVAALKRIEDGSYGECQECSEAIDEKRLVANSMAT